VKQMVRTYYVMDKGGAKIFASEHDTVCIDHIGPSKITLMEGECVDLISCLTKALEDLREKLNEKKAAK